MGFRFALPTREYKALCKRVMQRDGWKCRRCKTRNNLHCHHIIFRSQGGGDYSWNMITVCNDCHDKIHGLDRVVHLVIVHKSGDPDLEPNADEGVKFLAFNGYNQKRKAVPKPRDEEIGPLTIEVI